MHTSIDHITEGFATGACDVCGGGTLPNGAFWHGERTIEVCNECAPVVAAALVIDSAPATGPGHVKDLIRGITGRMWRAATFRAARDRQLEPSRN